MTGRAQVNASVLMACGTIVGYVAANAQQVVPYFLVPNKGSKASAATIGQALTESIPRQGAR